MFGFCDRRHLAVILGSIETKVDLPLQSYNNALSKLHKLKDQVQNNLSVRDFVMVEHTLKEIKEKTSVYRHICESRTQSGLQQCLVDPQVRSQVSSQMNQATLSSPPRPRLPPTVQQPSPRSMPPPNLPQSSAIIQNVQSTGAPVLTSMLTSPSASSSQATPMSSSMSATSSTTTRQRNNHQEDFIGNVQL